MTLLGDHLAALQRLKWYREEILALFGEAFGWQFGPVSPVTELRCMRHLRSESKWSVRKREAEKE